MKSKNWLWVVIAFLAIVVVYQIVRLPEGKSTDSPLPEIEPAFQPGQRATHVVSLAELSGMPEKKKQPVVELAKIEKPQKTTKIIENLAPSTEDQDTLEPAETAGTTETADAVETIAMKDPPSIMSDESVAGTIQAPITTIPTVKSSIKGLVRGIIYSEDHGFTLIDETIVKTGAVIDGAKVINIHAGGVEFERDGRRWTQKVGEALDFQWQ